MLKNSSKKNRLTWGMGVMLLCGVIIVALPWLMNRSNWDKGWGKPAVAPLWKKKSSSVTQRQTSISKFANLPFVRTSTEQWKFSGNGTVAAVERSPKLQRSFTVTGWTRPWIKQGNTSWQSQTKVSQPLAAGVWSEGGFDLYEVASAQKQSFLPFAPGNRRFTLTDGKKPFPGADAIFLSDDGKRACILSTMFDPRGNDGYGQITNQICLYDCSNGRLLLTRTVQRDRDFSGSGDYERRDIWVFSKDGHHFYEFYSPEKYQSEPWDKVELYDWVSNETILLKSEPRTSLHFWHSPTLSPDGLTFAVVSKTAGNSYSNNGEDGTAYVWDLEAKKLRFTFRQENFDPSVVLFSPDSQRIALGGGDLSISGAFATKGKLLVLDSQTGQIVSTLSEESPRDRFQQSKMQKEQQLAFRLHTHKSPPQTPYLPGDSGPVSSLEFSPDGTKLTASYGNGEIKMWKVPR